MLIKYFDISLCFIPVPACFFFPEVAILSEIELNLHAAVIQQRGHKSSSFTPSSDPMRIGMSCLLRLPAITPCFVEAIVTRRCADKYCMPELCLCSAMNVQVSVFSAGLPSVSTKVLSFIF